MPDNSTPPVPSSPASPSPSPVAVPAAKAYKGMAIASWVLICLTCLLALLPVIGFATWVIALVVVPLTLVFAIVILARGGKAQGIILILASVIFMPCFLLIAPVISTVVLGASISAKEQAQENQIKNNLNTIAEAKTLWAQETSAAQGTSVTMVQLKDYLGAIKPVVGESYDPRPIGEEPTAKLPASKSLASHKAGAEISAASTPTSTNSQSAISASPSPSASAEEE